MWLFYIFIWVSGWGAGSTITMLSLIKWFPLVISWARHTSQPQCSSLSVWCVSGGRTGVNTEQPSVWRWRCWTTPTDAVSQSVRQVKPASKHSATPPPPSPPPGRCQSYVLALGWMEGTFPDYIHCDTAWVWMQAGCFSVTHAPSVTLGSSISSPCYRWSLFWSSVLSLTQLLWLHLCLSGFVPRICT